MLISPSALRKFIKSLNPKLRVAESFVARTEAELRRDIEAKVKRDGYLGTLRGDSYDGMPPR